MAGQTNILREANNNVELVGTLKSKDVREGTSSTGDYISISCVIATDENNEHRVSMNANRMTRATDTKPSQENRLYKTLCTIRDEYVSIAELMEQGKSKEEAWAQATKVTANRASLTLNEYYGQDGQLRSTVQIRATALNRPRSDKEFKPIAGFGVEVYIDRLTPEMKGDDETGRLILDAIVPARNGVAEPMRFIVAKEAASYVDSHYSKGDTVCVYGDLVNTVHVTTRLKEGFAKSVEEKEYTYVHELLITNGSLTPYDEDSPAAYRLADIKAAMKVRETEYLPGLKARSEARKSNSGAANGFAPMVANGMVAPPKKSNFSLEDL